MKINDNIIEKFIECWKKYDPLGECLISVNDLDDFICDLCEQELKIKGRSKEACFFHLTQDYKLTLYIKYKRKIGLDGPRMEKVCRSPDL